MRRLARKDHFDLAVAHGSNDLALAAASLGIPAVNTFDYEWATQQHQIGCRLARRVMVPEAIPPERLRRYGVGPHKLRQYAGLKEEYYLSDFEPDAAVLDQLALDRARILVVVRPPPDVSIYHRKANRLFPQVLDHLGNREDVQAIVIPRTDEQRVSVRALNMPSLVVPDGAIDAQSLIALSDLVVSAGGTMNREAVALGKPVYTTYGGRLGGVDELLIREGRLRPLTDPRAMEIAKHPDGERARAPQPAGLGGPDPGSDRVSTAALPPTEENLITSYERMAHTYERPAVDRVLRSLDITLSGVALVVPVAGDRAHRARRARGAAAARCSTAASGWAGPGACSRCTSSAPCGPTPSSGWARSWASSSRS